MLGIWGVVFQLTYVGVLDFALQRVGTSYRMYDGVLCGKRCWGYGVLGVYDVGDMGCWGCMMLGIWGVGGV